MRLTALLLFLVASLAFAAAPEPEWVAVAPVRASIYHNAGPLLADVDARLDKWGQGELDRAGFAPATHAHEGTHMVNAMVRNAAKAGRVNAFYCLHGKAVVVREPKTSIYRVASFIPANLRGGRYRLYIDPSNPEGQAKQWNDRPLYLLDEWVAYTNEAEVLLDQAAADLPYDRDTDVSFGQVEFTAYALAVVRAVEEDDPKYLETPDGKNLKAFVAWNAARAFRQYDDCQKVPGLKWRDNGVRENIAKCELGKVLARIGGGDAPAEALSVPPQSTLPAKNPVCPCKACGCDGCDCRGGKCLCPSCMANGKPPQSTLFDNGPYEKMRARADREGRFLATWVGPSYAVQLADELVGMTDKIIDPSTGKPAIDGDVLVSGPWPGHGNVHYETLHRPKPGQLKAALDKAKAEYDAERAKPRQPKIIRTQVPTPPDDCPPGGS